MVLFLALLGCSLANSHAFLPISVLLLSTWMLSADIINGWCNHTKVKSRNTAIAPHLQEGADVLRHAVEGSRGCSRVHQAGRRGDGGRRRGGKRRQRWEWRSGRRGITRGTPLLTGDALLLLCEIFCVGSEGRELKGCFGGRGRYFFGQGRPG